MLSPGLSATTSDIFRVHHSTLHHVYNLKHNLPRYAHLLLPEILLERVDPQLERCGDGGGKLVNLEEVVDVFRVLANVRKTSDSEPVQILLHVADDVDSISMTIMMSDIRISKRQIISRSEAARITVR
ncbi:uncharacterized protein EKO05_0007280 [Ascochyta rabiei]|uniref:Uncharacterized protein n=1 Tax=Didymella rabiei TaxID=5454 RepID=A0A163BVA9_DIDRA|nr:uncharacterized protein EKO05_0007280 [Ascochyta rabiei]KZM22024.1 hypothetical protein ST47_g6829 [Ascochyta rabiei]UPX16899.1 hypothetical protein EKO05_0007280 [Ascochyta rabiei]